MAKIIMTGLAAFITVLAVIIALQPSHFSVTRSLAMNAPASEIFAEVNDFRRWKNWSPWAKLDPDAIHEFSGEPAGEGAVMAWDGNHDVGKGSMTIVESQEPGLVRLRLDFLKPMKATNETIFQFQEQGDQTLVTWTMSGENHFIAKAINLVIDCDTMIGGYFEKGLTSLKSVVEAP